MGVDEKAMRIADAAAAGQAPSREDVEYLLSFDGISPEAAYVGVRAREIGMRAAAGRAFVFAQIGVDATPCPENCQFCAFAATNAGADSTAGLQAIGKGDAETGNAGAGSAVTGAFEVPIDAIVTLARVFDEEGVHLISLMATAGLTFSRFLDMVEAVRDSVRPDMPIMANAADLTLEQAQMLRQAGAQAAYHARRLHEGEITAIPPARRMETMRNIRDSGLLLMTGVEPLWKGVEDGEVADRICELSDLGPFCIGACGLSVAPGTAMAGYTPALRPRIRYVGAIARLAVGKDVPIGGVGGVTWVDAGTDPRSRGYGQEPAWLRHSVRRARRDLFYDGWQVPDRAPQDIFAQ